MTVPLVVEKYSTSKVVTVSHGKQQLWTDVLSMEAS